MVWKNDRKNESEERSMRTITCQFQYDVGGWYEATRYGRGYSLLHTFCKLSFKLWYKIYYRAWYEECTVGCTMSSGVSE